MRFFFKVLILTVSHSGVSRDPRGTVVPPCLQGSKSISPSCNLPSTLTPPPGLIPSGNGAFTGLTFRCFLLYIVLTTATSFSNSFFIKTFPNRSHCVISSRESIVMLLTATVSGGLSLGATSTPAEWSPRLLNGERGIHARHPWRRNDFVDCRLWQHRIEQCVVRLGS